MLQNPYLHHFVWKRFLLFVSAFSRFHWIKITIFFFWTSFDWLYKFRHLLEEIFVNKVSTGLFSRTAVKELTVSFLHRYFLLTFKNVIKYPHGIVCSIVFSAHDYNMTENHPLHKPKPNVFIMDNVWLLPFFTEKSNIFIVRYTFL